MNRIIFYTGSSLSGAALYFSQESIWFMHVEKIIQNLLTASAILTNKYLVRVAENGLSYIITNTGESTLLSADKGDFISERISFNSHISFYAHYYNVINIIYFLLIGIGIVFYTLKELGVH